MICEIGITVLVLLVSGLFGCGNSREYKVDDIALINTTYYGMTREPVYSFALQKEKEDWFFSASCYVEDQKAYYASFSSLQIPCEEAEGFLEIIREEGEIKRFRKYHEPIRLFQTPDAPACSSEIVFSDGSRVDRGIAFGDKALRYLYALAGKYYETAENYEGIRAVSVQRCCMDHSSSYLFTIEKEGNDWFFSYDAVIDSSNIHTEVEKQRIEEKDAEEILRIVKEEQLVTAVKGYEEPLDDDIMILDETTYQISFEFEDGSSIDAPIDAGASLIDAFYTLATVKNQER